MAGGGWAWSVGVVAQMARFQRHPHVVYLLLRRSRDPSHHRPPLSFLPSVHSRPICSPLCSFYCNCHSFPVAENVRPIVILSSDCIFFRGISL